MVRVVVFRAVKASGASPWVALTALVGGSEKGPEIGHFSVVRCVRFG